MAEQIARSTLAAPPDTYFFSLARSANTFAAIASDDSLRLFDLSGLALLDTIRPCHNGVSCLAPSPDHRAFYTAGRDGLVRSFDLRSKSTGIQLSEPNNAGFSSLACREHYVAAGTESTKEGLGDVAVLIYDSRNPSAPLRSYRESHTDSITALSWHPDRPNLLLSGSTDGLVSMLDVDQSDEDDALQQVLNPRSAIHCAGFLPCNQAYVLSTDERLWVYGLPESGTPDDEALSVTSFGDLRPNLDCMYVVGLLQHPSLPNPLVAHGHTDRKELVVSSWMSPQSSFGPSVNLPGAHGDDVVRDVQLADDDTIISCGEDGNVRVWSLRIDKPASGAGEMKMDEDTKATRKKTKTDKKDRGRFAPY